MKKKCSRWNKDKRHNFVSLQTIRKTHYLLRMLKSPYAKENSKYSILANEIMSNLKNKKEARRVLFLELKKNNIVVNFRKRIDAPNNIYSIIMKRLNSEN